MGYVRARRDKILRCADNFLLAVNKLKKYNNFRLIFCILVLSLRRLRGQTV